MVLSERSPAPPENQRVFLLKAPYVADHDMEILVVVRGVRRGVEHASQRIRGVLYKKWIRLRFVHERKQALRDDGPRTFPAVAVLEKGDGREAVRMQSDEGHKPSGMDDREMVFRVWLQRPDGEVEISRRERNQKIRVRLFLNRDGLCVEAGDCGGKRTVVFPDLKATGRL